MCELYNLKNYSTGGITEPDKIVDSYSVTNVVSIGRIRPPTRLKSLSSQKSRLKQTLVCQGIFYVL
jgi:hypothetical protein